MPHKHFIYCIIYNCCNINNDENQGEIDNANNDDNEGETNNENNDDNDKNNDTYKNYENIDDYSGTPQSDHHSKVTTFCPFLTVFLKGFVTPFFYKGGSNTL